ncbi:putative HTH-type transcriptional regulator [Abditibacteriota bacterium]|nr:putative HTH-type transcriptional regulator [Abditibacteriota bacterium]
MWNLNFFGGLRASSQDRVIERFRTQKTAALLALLALRGARSREDVCALLWPDASPEASRNSLSAALSALRRDLGDDIVRADRTSVSLLPSLYQTDTALFNDAFKADDFTRAVELYRGHLLPGFHEDPFPALEREYEEKARTAFKARLEELEENGQSSELLELARRAASLFGDDERWFLALMRAHYGLGDLDAALRAYDSLGRFMRKSGDTASESARVLAKLIRRDKEREAAAPPVPAFTRRPLESPSPQEVPSPAAPSIPPPPESSIGEEPEIEAPRNNLPTQWTRFFGREGERAVLRGWLRDGQKMVTLSGAGGSGKTRLSLETLRELTAEWEGDIVFVPLAPLSDPELILPAIRDALQLTGTPDLSPLEQIERALRGRRALLFLDNFEQLVEGGAARLQALRERLPQTTFLVTSRVLLQLPGEREFPVAPLPTPLRNTAPSEVRECASAALFCDRSGLILDASNAEAVGALCRRLDGIPLALELAAARAKVLSPAQILERLQKHPDFLQSRELGVPARHKTLRATIEWSTDLLPPDLREFWTRLSLFHGGWTLDAAEKIAAPGICEDWETLDWLTLLRECSLIFTEERGDSSRFRMLQTLREFGREQLQRTEEVERAFFDFYLGLAQQAASAMQGPGQTAWLARLDAEQDNLRAALTYARDYEPERGLLLATALIDFWETRLSLDEGRSWIETFLRATAPPVVEKPATPEKSAPRSASTAPSPNLDARARALSGAGRMASHSIELGESRALVEQGLEVARQSGSEHNFVYAVASFVRFAMTSGEVETDMARAKDLSEEAVSMARQTADTSLLAEALSSLSYIRISLADFNGLRPLYEEAIVLLRRLRDDARLSRMLSSLAHLCYHEKKWDEANALLDESTPLARHFASPWELMEALWVRSNVARESGRLDVARATITEEWEICRDNPTFLWARSMNMMMIGYLRIREGEAPSAVRIWGAEEVLRETADFRNTPVIRLDYNRYREEARRILGPDRFDSLWKEGCATPHQEAVDAALYGSDQRDPSALAARSRALSGAGRMAWYASDLENSENLLSQGLDTARRSGDASLIANAARSSALGTTAFGDAARARELGRESVRLARESGDNELLFKALTDLGMAEINISDFAAAEVVCREAVALARKQGNDRILATALVTLAIAYTQLYRYDEARVLVTESEALARRLGAVYELMVAITLRGHIASAQGNHDEARAAFHESLSMARSSISGSWTLVNMLLSASYSFSRRGDAPGCARIMGACQAIAENIGYELMPFLRRDYDHFRAASLHALGEAELTREWIAGRLLTSEQVIDFILTENASPQSGNSTLSTRSLALSGASRLAWYDNDFAASRTLVEQGLETARKSGDTASYVHAVAAFVRIATVSGAADLKRGEALAEETVRLSREANDESLLIEALISLSYATMSLGKLEGLRPVLDEAIELARKLGDELQVATAQVSLATLAYHEGKYAESRELLAESTATCRRLNSPFMLFACLWCESHVARESDDLESAKNAIIENLELCRDNPAFHWSISNALLSASYLLVRRGDIEGGVQLMSVADALAERSGYQIMPLLRLDFERYRVLARQLLDEATSRRAWEQGQTQTFSAALDFAFERLINTTPSDPLLATRAQALSGAGRLAWHDSDFAASRALVEQGLEAARQSGDTAAFVHAATSFARMASGTGDIDGDIAKGRHLCEEAVRLSRAQNEDSLLVESLNSLAYATMTAGELTGMREVLEESVLLARKLGDDIQLATALVTLATLDYHEEQFGHGSELLTEGTALCRRLNSPFLLFACLWCASHIAREQDDFGLSATALTEALELCRDNPAFRWNATNGLVSAGELFVRRGDVAAGAQLLSAALSVGEQIGYQLSPLLRVDFERYSKMAHQILGDATFQLVWEQGQLQTFTQTLDFALERLTRTESPDPLLATRARALSGAGRMAWYASDLDNAEELLRQGLKEARRSGDSSLIAHAARSSALATTTSGDPNEARDLGRESVRVARESGDRSALLKSLTDLGFAEINVSDFVAAEAVCREAVTLARQEGNERSLALALVTLGIACLYQARRPEARAALTEGRTLALRQGAVFELMVSWATLAVVESLEGNHDAARLAYREAIVITRETMAASWSVVNLLVAVAYCFFRRGDARGCTRIMAASNTLAQNIGYELMPFLVPDNQHFRAECRRVLGDAEFEREWQIGRAWTPDEMMDFALRAGASPIAEPHDPLLATRARALSGAGRLAWYASDMEKADALLRQGMDASRQLGDTAGIVYATRGLTRSSAVMGDSSKARELASESLLLARASGDSSLLIKSLVDLAFAELYLGRFASVRELSSEAVALARQSGDEVALPLALILSAIAHSHDNRVEEALELLRQGEEIARRLGSVWDLQMVLSNKGDVLSRLGEHARAQEVINECLVLCRQLFTESWSVANIWIGIAYNYIRRGDTRDGVRLMGAAEAMRERIGYELMPLMLPDHEASISIGRQTLGETGFAIEMQRGAAMTPDEVFDFAIRPVPTTPSTPPNGSNPDAPSNEILAARARALSGAGRLAWYASDMQQASSLLEQGLNASRAIGDTEGIVYATRGLTRTAAATGDSVKSLDVAHEALQLARASGDKSLLVKALLDLGFADINVGDLSSALTLSAEAIYLSREIGDEAALSLALNIGAIALSYQDKDDEALALIRQSEEVARRIGSVWDLLVVLSVKGHSLSRLGKHDAALEAANEGLTLCRESFAESWTVANSLVAASYTFMRRGEVRDGAQIMGAADAMRERIGYEWMPVMVSDYEKFVSLARQTLGDAEFEAVLRRGAAMTPGEIFDFAIRPLSTPTPPTSGGNEATSNERLAARSRALSGAGRLAWHSSDFEATRALVEQGLDSARQAGDLPSFVRAVAAYVRFAMVTGDIEGYMAQALVLSEEAVARSRQSGDKALLLDSLTSLAFAHVIVSRFREAHTTNEEAIALARELGDETRLVQSLNNLAAVYFHQDRYDLARTIVEESLPRCRQLGSTWELIVALWTYSAVLREQGELELADKYIIESLELCRANPAFRWGIYTVLTTMGYLFIRRGAVRDGVRLMGASEALRQSFGYHLVPVLRAEYERYQTEAKNTLGEAAFETAWEQGTLLSPEAAIELALHRDETTFANDAAPASTVTDEVLAARSRALSGAGRLAWHDSDLKASRALVEQGLETARKSGDLSSFVRAVAAFVRFAMVTEESAGLIEQSRLLAKEAVARSGQVGDKTALLDSLISLGYATCVVMLLQEANVANQEAIALARELGDNVNLARALTIQVGIYYYENNPTPARPLLDECIKISRQLNSTWDLIAIQFHHSGLARLQGQLEESYEAIAEALELCRANPNYRWNVSHILMTASYLFVERDELPRAVRLMAASEAISASVGYRPPPVMLPEYERNKTRAHEMLGAAAFQTAWEEGSTLTPDAAIELALSPADVPVRDETVVPNAALAARSRALSGAGRLAWHDSDLEASRVLVTEGLEAARRSGDLSSFVRAVAAFVRFAMVTDESAGLIEQSRLLAQEAIQRSRQAGDKAALLDSLTSLGYATCVLMRMQESTAANEEAIALARELGDNANLGRALTIQIGVYYHENNPVSARPLLEECIEVSRQLDSAWDLIAVQWLRSGIARKQGLLDESSEAIAEVLDLCRANPNYKWSVSHVFMMAAYLFVERGELPKATRLMAASEAVSASVGYRPTPNLIPEYEDYKARVREALGEAEFQTVWEEGISLTHDAAIELALSPANVSARVNATVPDAALAARSRALSGVARLASQGSDIESSRALVNQGLEAARESDDLASFVYAVAAHVRFAMMTGDTKGVIPQSRLLGAEAVARSRREGNKALLLDSLISFGYATCIVSRFKEAQKANEEAIALARELSDETNLVRALNNQVNVYYHQGIYPPARIILEESEELSRRLNSNADLIASLWGLTTVAREQGELDVADTAMTEILEICRANPTYRWGISNILVTASYLFIKHGDATGAVHLMSAAAAISESLGYRIIPVLVPDYERYQSQAREMLGETAFAEVWEEGRVLTADAAIELALQPPHTTAHTNAYSTNALSDDVLAARSRALSGAGRLAWHGSDLEASRLLVNQGLEAARESGDVSSFVYAVAAFVRFAMVTGDLKGVIAQSRFLGEEAVARSRRAGDKALLLDSLISLGYANVIVSQFRESYIATEEAIALARELGDETNLVRSLNNQASVYYHQGIYPPALVILEESEELCRRLNSTWDLIAARWTLSSVAREQGELELADAAISEVLEICRATPSFRWGVSNVLMTMSYLFLKRDDATNAVRLMAASEAISELLGYHPVPVLLIEYKRYKAQARELLGETAFQTAWEEGHVLTPDAAIELALRR